jgi:hypothetical protein
MRSGDTITRVLTRNAFLLSPFVPPPPSLRVPAGVDSGSRLRVRGEGNAGRRGGPEGDLYVFISVRPDPALQRDGININCGVSISYVDAILGPPPPPLLRCSYLPATQKLRISGR